MMKIQTFIDKIQTENLRVKNPNSLDKIQHYGNTGVCFFNSHLQVVPLLPLFLTTISFFPGAAQLMSGHR